MRRGRVRRALILLLALGGPPTVVWTGTALLRASSAPPPKPRRLEHFSDYLKPPQSTPALPEGTELWRGDPGEGVPFFSTMTLGNDTLYLLSSGRLVAINVRTGRVRTDFLASENAAFGSVGASAVTPADTADRVWLYTPESGAFFRYELTPAFRRLEGYRLAPALRSLIWFNDRLVTNGAFPSELVRVFEPLSSAGKPSKVVATLGRPLFPEIVPTFAPHMNSTFITPSRDRSQLAVAYQWTNRIDIYDLNDGTLERSIAGPVLPRLDFDVDGTEAKPLLTLSGDTEWAYVDLETAGDVILGLYAGRERRKHGMSFALGTEVHAFTWDGRLVGRWRVHDPLQKLEYDDKTRTLYGLRWHPAKSVVAIDASPILDAARRVPHPSSD